MIITLYIDADACPVKQEVYRVAERHALKGTALKVYIVANTPIAVPRSETIERVVVGAGMDPADDWIAEHPRTRAAIVLPHPKKDLGRGLVRNIYKQAGWQPD